MRTRKHHYITKKSSGQKVSIDFNGFATLQPTVRLVRLPLPISPPKRRGRRPKAVQSRRDRTSSSLVRARGRTRTHRVSAVQTFSDQSESDRSTPPKLKINRSDKKLEKSDQIFDTNQTAQTLVYANNDMVRFCIGLDKKCYAVKVFPKPYDSNAGTFKDYLTKSMDETERLCNSISNGMLNIKRYPQVTDCKDISRFALKRVIDTLNFEGNLHEFHVSEKRLRDLNNQIIEALQDHQLGNCIHALDELYLLFVKRVVKLMLRKQPRIVCTLFNLASQQIDGYSPQWNMIKSIVARNIDIIKEKFDFSGSDKDFQKWFLLQMEMFTEMTAHLNELEKFELIDDPVKGGSLPDVALCL